MPYRKRHGTTATFFDWFFDCKTSGEDAAQTRSGRWPIAGRLEGTLSKCGANHVFTLDDPEHLPTPSAHPSSPQLHIAPRLGIFLCVACSQAAKLAAAELSRRDGFVSLRRVVANWQQCRTNGTGQVPIAFEKAHKW
jgi:hypothetical protein